jgi:hypothetical protein
VARLSDGEVIDLDQLACCHSGRRLAWIKVFSVSNNDYLYNGRGVGLAVTGYFSD